MPPLYPGQGTPEAFSSEPPIRTDKELQEKPVPPNWRARKRLIIGNLYGNAHPPLTKHQQNKCRPSPLPLPEVNKIKQEATLLSKSWPSIPTASGTLILQPQWASGAKREADFLSLAWPGGATQLSHSPAAGVIAPWKESVLMTVTMDWFWQSLTFI